MLSDAQLLALCRAGDGPAWSELVDRYQRLVFSVALRDGLDVKDAADVTHTTFVALLDSIAELRSDERLAAWLMTVARRTAWRVRKRCEREAGVFASPSAVDDCDWEQIAAVHEGLARLGSASRDLLMEGAIGGIGEHRARCLQQLHALMDGEGSR